MKLRRCGFDLNPIIMDNISLYEENAKKKKITIHNAVLSPCSVFADKSMIDPLLSALQFGEPLDSACGGCLGDITLWFYDGDSPLKRINIHDGETAYWTHGKHRGQYDLTDESKPALRDWLRANGCPTPDEAEEVALRIRKSDQASESNSVDAP